MAGARDEQGSPCRRTLSYPGMSGHVHFPKPGDNPQSRQSTRLPSFSKAPFPRGSVIVGDMTTGGFRLNHGDGFRIVTETLWVAGPISR